MVQANETRKSLAWVERTTLRLRSLCIQWVCLRCVVCFHQIMKLLLHIVCSIHWNFRRAFLQLGASAFALRYNWSQRGQVSSRFFLFLRSRAMTFFVYTRFAFALYAMCMVLGRGHIRILLKPHVNRIFYGKMSFSPSHNNSAITH